MVGHMRKYLKSDTEIGNPIESLRVQLYNLSNLIQGEQNAVLRKSADELDKKLTDVEDNLIQRKLTGQGQDSVRWPTKLVSKLGYLASGLSGSDFGPTNQQREVQALLKGQLMTQRTRLDAIIS